MNQYPLWRYILLIVVLILSLVYAAPNFYGEDPAVQITTKNAVAMNAAVPSQLKTLLSKNNIAYKAMDVKKSEILIRFHDTNTQLKSQELIKAVLGDGFTTALTLAERTPAWLAALGAHPMRLGLDLRGGIHLLLDVDVDSLIKARMQSALHSIGDELRGANVRYVGMAATKQGVSMEFRTADDQDKALAIMQKNFPNYQFSTNSDNGKFLVTGALTADAIAQIRTYAIQQNTLTINKRVNGLGVSEAVVQQVGSNQISVDLPGMQDAARAKDLVGKVATLKFQLVDIEHDAGQAASTGIVPFGDKLYYYEGRPILVKNQVILRGDDIVNASSAMGDDGRPSVSVQVGSGVSYFNRMTGQNINKPLAVIYVETKPEVHMVKGKPVMSHRQVETIISSANIESALGNNFQITGLDSAQYAQNLALQLRSGALTVPVLIVSEKLVGPSLGAANIHKGVMSTIVGSLLVFLFMAIYYRLFGLISDLALILNLLIIVAVMSLLGFTLTLPGIAGIVLTVGMAVDANVLINERIREELRLGTSPQAAIYAGYARAFSTIVDSNVTTLIVAVVLLALGTGSVKGLAITIIIGLLTSMFTAIMGTRSIVNLIYGKRAHLKHISIGIRVEQKR